jgi:hypothetical protein
MVPRIRILKKKTTNGSGTLQPRLYDLLLLYRSLHAGTYLRQNPREENVKMKADLEVELGASFDTGQKL